MNRDSDSDLYSQTTNWLVGTAKRNPEGLLLLAAGCALLLRSKSSPMPSMRSDWSVQHAQDGVSRAVGDATTYAADIKKKVSDTVNQATESVSDMAGDATRALAVKRRVPTCTPTLGFARRFLNHAGSSSEPPLDATTTKSSPEVP